MAQGALLPAYLLVGPDELKAQTSIKRLKKYLAPDFAEFNFDELYATSELEVGVVLGSLNMFPMGEGPRIVILHDADQLTSSNKDVKKALIEYLKAPNPGCTLLLVAKSMRSNDTLYKAIAAMGKNTIISCELKKDYQMPQEVAQMAKTLGLQMDTRTAAELARRVGIDRKLIDQSLRMLLALHPENPVISYQDVVREIAFTAQLKPWDLPDAISERNAALALECLERTEPHFIYSTITNISERLRQLLAIKGLKQRGQSSQAATILGINPYIARNMQGFASNYSEKQLIDCLGLCLAQQKKILQGMDAHDAIVELIVSICR